MENLREKLEESLVKRAQVLQNIAQSLEVLTSLEEEHEKILIEMEKDEFSD